MKKFALISIIFFLLFFVLYLIGFFGSEEESILNKIESETAKELNRKYNLSLAMEGAAMMEEIKEVTLAFSSQKACTVEQAREMLVFATELFLKNINKNKKIRKYLIRFPFTVKGVITGIAFMKDGDFIYSPYIYTAWNHRGKLEYQVMEKNSQKETVVLEETYKEALKIVQGTQK